MPHNFDFSTCLGEIHTVEINPKGWRGPICIEYGVGQNSKYDTQASIVWRVRGTTHTFSIYENRLNVISHANYQKHFEEALERFRIDYLSWFREPEYKDVQWKYEYREQYGDIIIPDAGEDNESEN